MPTLETMDLTQKAVLWAALDTGNSSDYDNDGNRKVSAASEIDVRWEEGKQQALDPQGSPIGIDSSAVINQEIILGSIMWLGEQADLADTPTNLREVVTYTSIPDIKGRNFRRVVGMIKYSDSLPTISS